MSSFSTMWHSSPEEIAENQTVGPKSPTVHTIWSCTGTVTGHCKVSFFDSAMAVHIFWSFTTILSRSTRTLRNIHQTIAQLLTTKKKIERSVTIPLFLLKLSVLTVLFLFGVRTVHTARILRIRPGGGANIEPQHGKTCRKSAGNPINPSLDKAKCFPD